MTYRRKSKFVLINVILVMMLCYNSSAASKMKFVYKLQVTDYRGNLWLDYTVVEPPTYISYNGGWSVIKRVRVLDYWCIQTEESLYGKSVEEIERWVPKRPQTPRTTPGAYENPAVPGLLPLSVTSKDLDEAKVVKIPRLNSEEHLVSLRIQSPQTAQHASRFVKMSPPEVSRIKDRLAPDTPLQRMNQRQEVNSGLEERSPSTSFQRLNPHILRRLRPYNRWINQAAQRYRIDPRLLKALVYVESAGNPRAQSEKSAMGLTQLIPQTAREVGVHNVFDPRQNLLGGAKYLDQQLQSFGNEMAALAAYNAGPNRIRRGSLPPETREYVKKVLAVKNLLGSQ